MNSNRIFWVAAFVVLNMPFGGVIAQTNMGDPLIFQHLDGRTMPYRFLQPPAVIAGREYPLIVFLHGAGERGTDNRIQMQQHITGLRAATQTEAFASYLIAPQLPSGDTFWSPTQIYDLTNDIIDQVASNYPVDRSRIYVTGLSLGGNGSFNYLSAFPHEFAAAVPMSGWGTPSTAAMFADVPVWTFHGDADTTVNVSGSRDMYYALDAAGSGPLHSEIQRGGHVIWSPIYSDWQLNRHGLYPWLFSKALPAQENRQVIDTNASWRFLDNGSDQGVAWRQIEFDDTAWKSGAGQLGYGENDQVTIVNCGPSSPTCLQDNFATTYFRYTFEVDDTTALASLSAELVRDDSAIVYLNGVEIYRDAILPTGAGFQTFAGNTDNSHVGFVIDPSRLHLGTNLVAVEVHQGNASDGDLSFDFRLNALVVPEPGSFLNIEIGLACSLTWLRRKGFAGS